MSEYIFDELDMVCVQLTYGNEVGISEIENIISEMDVDVETSMGLQDVDDIHGEVYKTRKYICGDDEEVEEVIDEIKDNVRGIKNTHDKMDKCFRVKRQDGDMGDIDVSITHEVSDRDFFLGRFYHPILEMFGESDNSEALLCISDDNRSKLNEEYEDDEVNDILSGLKKEL